MQKPTQTEKERNTTMSPARERSTTRMMQKQLTTAVVAAAFALGLAANGRGQTPPADSPEGTKAILLRMAEFIATNSFTVDVRDNYDVYQESGQKIEFNESRKITLIRPDRLRIEAEESDGQKQVLTFNGQDLTLATLDKKVYAQTPKSGNLDDAIVFFVRDLGLRIPFALLLKSTAPEEMVRRTTSLDYVEKTKIFGTPAHHLALRTATVDYQVWIADGDRPLPLRLVLTYPGSEGQPEFRAQFSNWTFSPKVAASKFTFVPSPGMQRISFLAQLPWSVTNTASEDNKSNSPK